MKKLILCVVTALMALTVCFAVLAENAGSNGLYDSLVNLMFRTNNVTLKAKVDFSLDGEWFKTAEGTWQQDYSRSFRELILRAPKADGTERKNGYTILTEGEKFYLIEAFNPGVYRSGNTVDHSSILRNTVESEQLIKLGRALMANTDLLLGKDVLTENGDSFSIKMNEAPALFNSVLNQAVTYTVRRYFGVDYDRCRSDNQQSIYSYGTKTQGLIYTMKEVALQSADITVKKAADGNISHAEGKLSLYVTTAADGIHQLDITLQADVTDLGTTMVRKFDPKEFNVVNADEQYGYFIDAGQEAEGAASEDAAPMNNAKMSDKIGIEAMEAWARSGFNMTVATSVDFGEREDDYEVDIADGKGSMWKTFFKKDGSFSSMQAEPNDWQTDLNKYTYNPSPDAAADAKAKAFLMDFMENVTPDALGIVKDLKMEWIYEVNGAVYAQYNEYPLNQQGNGVLLVVRMSPELRVEYYSCTANG